MPSWPESRKNQELAISSVSANKWVFVKVFTSTAECFEHLESKGFASVVTSPHDKRGAPSITLTNGSFTESKLAVWFGNESKGISDEAVVRATKCVKLDMYGYVESLNLSVCAGIVLAEVVKQRRAYCEKKKSGQIVKN
jgi:tRNA (guanosine-2'-O-)-methyltransferase